MFGTPRTRTVLSLAWLMFWALMVAVAIQDYQRAQGKALWQPVLWETSSAVVGTVLLVLLRRWLCRHDEALLPTPARWIGLQLAAMPVFYVLFVPITFAIRHGVYGLMGDTYRHEPWGQVFVYEGVKLVLFYSIFTVIMFGVLSYQALLREKEKAREADRLLGQAQLQRLTQQMQPHFLFNALNTVSSLMHSDVNKADATLMQLADMLRATLDTSEQQQVPLETELRLARGYAQLMAERFADRVTLDWQIDEAALACSVPVLSLQPLIENVFKHTVERRRQMTHLRVAAQCQAGRLRLWVEDDQGQLSPEVPPQGEGSGIGLANLRARLQVLHGTAASLTLTALVPGGVRAELSLPCGC
jgi:two-component system LytT family sensor kinase